MALVLHSACRLKVLSLSCVFPNPASPASGLFIRSRLLHVAVLAPVVRFPWSGSDGVPPRRDDGPLDVIHPRWMYPPGAGLFNAVLLFLQLLPALLHLRRKFPFEVIDSHFAFPEGIAAALLSKVLRVPFLVTLRGCEILHSQYRWRRWGMSWALRRASLVVTVSEPLRELAIQLGAPPERVVRIPNGVDAKVFHPRSRIESQRKHRLNPDQFTILTAGHLIDLKGHHLVIEALQRLKQEHIPARLLIAGGDPARSVPSYGCQLRQQVADLGLDCDVSFLGEVSQESLAELMAAADLFCMASTREGWPNVVHEAMACGTPVVATNVGAVPEMIVGENFGLIVPPNDVAALAAAVRRAITTEWDRPAISAFARARSWEQVAAEVVERLRGVSNGGSGCLAAK
jgi:teichuronic acid biosynthesis glycosyltransferase TuaC